MDAEHIAWSSDTAQADWIGPRLSPFSSGVASLVIPGGFDAYARLLHPANGRGGAPVRWAEVAAWSGVPLERDGQFADVAVPQHRPATPSPAAGGRPEEGSLESADAAALVDVLEAHTKAGALCWFCLWEGYGWIGGQGVAMLMATKPRRWPRIPRLLRPRVRMPPRFGRRFRFRFGLRFRARSKPRPSIYTGPRPEFVPTGPVPAAAFAGPRVELPNRNYLLYSGEVSGALALVASEHQTPNLWWPADRCWCVATEIDLPWTYVGGSAELIGAILADPRLEAMPAEPEDRFWSCAPAWVDERADAAARELLAHGRATVSTQWGTVEARLRRPRRWRDGELTIGGPGRSGWTRIDRRSEADLYRNAHDSIADAIVNMALDDGS